MKPNWLRLLVGIILGGIAGAVGLSVFFFVILKIANPKFPDPLGYWMLMFLMTVPLGGIVGAILGCVIANRNSNQNHL